MDAKQLCEGTHQRVDGSYFEVLWISNQSDLNEAGWYWWNFTRVDEGTCIQRDYHELHGPYLTQAAAARAGWANDPEASDAA